jgi:hypothetical protein
MAKDKEQEDYDKDDERIRKELPDVNLGRAYCTECHNWYDVATQADAHAH